MSDIFSDVSDFESRLNLPKDFYRGLLKEDDWSFIIKVSALFEAATTHLLVVRFGTPEIETEFYNFSALNIPLEHASRDSFDTFYTKQGQLLRS